MAILMAIFRDLSHFLLLAVEFLATPGAAKLYILSADNWDVVSGTYEKASILEGEIFLRAWCRKML